MNMLRLDGAYGAELMILGEANKSGTAAIGHDIERIGSLHNYPPFLKTGP
jgi:hypothetical protein